MENAYVKKERVFLQELLIILKLFFNVYQYLSIYLPVYLSIYMSSTSLSTDTMSVSAWLQSIGVDAEQPVFDKMTKEKVDIVALKGLTDEQLKELGFRMGDSSKILQQRQHLGLF